MFDERRTALVQQRHQLRAYARMKLEASDWHGVADAAMDVREIDARLEELDRVEQSGPWVRFGQESVWKMPPPRPSLPSSDPAQGVSDAATPAAAESVRVPPSVRASVVGGVRGCDAAAGPKSLCVLAAGHDGPHTSADGWMTETR